MREGMFVVDFSVQNQPDLRSLYVVSDCGFVPTSTFDENLEPEGNLFPRDPLL